MNTGTTPSATLAGSQAAAPADTNAAATTKKTAKNSITISFDEQDSVLFANIQKAAAADDRTEAKFLLLYLRKNFNKA